MHWNPLQKQDARGLREAEFRGTHAPGLKARLLPCHIDCTGVGVASDEPHSAPPTTPLPPLNSNMLVRDQRRAEVAATGNSPHGSSEGGAAEAVLVASKDQKARPHCQLLTWRCGVVILHDWVGVRKGGMLPVINHERLEEPTETNPCIEG